MALPILHELHERLKTAMIAGTSVLYADERLASLVQQLSVLSSKSFVFEKLYQLCEPLIQPETTHLQEQLVQAMSFLRALLCTQATDLIETESHPIRIRSYQSITNIKYSTIKPLIGAYTSKGGGRMEIVQKAWKKNPAIFHDHRILPYVIQGLGDSYGELANFNQWILSTIGDSIVPFLKDGFDPSRGKEMLRRMELIVGLMKGKEQAFYLDCYPEADTAMKKEIIKGLSYCEDTIAFLLTIADKEKGKLKEAILYAISRRKNSQADAYLLEKIKKRSSFLAYAMYPKSDEIVYHICEKLKELVLTLVEEERIQLTYKEEEELLLYTRLLAYKDQEEVFVLMDWLLQQQDFLGKLKSYDKHPLRIVRLRNQTRALDFCFLPPSKQDSICYTEFLMEMLLVTYLYEQKESCFQRIKQLYERYPDIGKLVYAQAVLVHEPQQAYDRLIEVFDQEEDRMLYTKLLSFVEFEEREQLYYFKKEMIADPLVHESVNIPLMKQLDLRWLDRLQGKKPPKKGLFAKLTQRKEPEIAQCSHVMIHLIDSKRMDMKEQLVTYAHTCVNSIYGLYILHAYQQPMLEPLLNYIRHQKNRSCYGDAALIDAFCEGSERYQAYEKVIEDYQHHEWEKNHLIRCMGKESEDL